MYRVLVAFTDIQDNDHKYLPGYIYPRKGLNPSPERIKELATTANKRHIRLIESDGTDVIEEVKAKKEKAPEKPVEEVTEVIEEPVAEEKEPEFMNPPVEPSEPVEEAPKKRGRKKNAD